MLEGDRRRAERGQNINYEDWKRRVSCVPASEIIYEFYDPSNAKDTLPMIAPKSIHDGVPGHPER